MQIKRLSINVKDVLQGTESIVILNKILSEKEAEKSLLECERSQEKFQLGDNKI